MKQRATIRSWAAGLGAAALFVAVPLSIAMPLSVWSAPGTAAAAPSGGNGEGWAGGNGGNATTGTGEGWAGGGNGPSQTSPPYYTNCTQILSQGGGPIYAGQPGYNPLLDPNHTGVDCG
ncbi:excalibur calcium-binding domain-containing protein [Nocardia sp. NPDC020380]|uniref:excalibur calcium-binding domain-containing protein n=1 Tax=Nocardia sp. NPDC020380 TaxID=3364309 RepID=UPI0037A6AEF4